MVRIHAGVLIIKEGGGFMGKKGEGRELLKRVLDFAVDVLVERVEDGEVGGKYKGDGSFVIWDKIKDEPFAVEVAEPPIKMNKAKWRCNACNPCPCELETFGRGDAPTECPVSRYGAAFWVEVKKCVAK